MTSRVFKILYENTGGFVSGEHIGGALGVSRAAVSKAIAELKAKGLEIVSVSKNGHKLISLNDCLDGDIISALTGKKTLFFKSCGSTNLEARKSEGVELVAAAEQTKGRGRRQREFASGLGGVYMSYIVKPSFSPRQSMLINLAAGLAVFDALKDLGFEPYLKYPNDVYIRGKKVCGILTETLADVDTLQWAITGIGINVNNELPKELSEKATSLAELKGQRLDRALIIKDVIKYFDYYLSQNIVMHYTKKCAMIGNRITITEDHAGYEAKAVGLTEDGLLVINRQGRDEVAVGGEVSVSFK